MNGDKKNPTHSFVKYGHIALMVFYGLGYFFFGISDIDPTDNFWIMLLIGAPLFYISYYATNPEERLHPILNSNFIGGLQYIQLILVLVTALHPMFDVPQFWLYNLFQTAGIATVFCAAIGYQQINVQSYLKKIEKTAQTKN